MSQIIKGNLLVKGHTVTNGLSTNIVTKTNDYTTTMNDSTILCDASSNNITITLIDASNAFGKIYSIKTINTSNGYKVNIETNGTQTIDDDLNITNLKKYESVTLQSDGSNWWIL